MDNIENVIGELNHIVKMYKIAKCRQFPIKKAVEALEKQIPKKPTEIDYDCSCFVCPSCGESIYSSEHLETHKFCLECGQAIDWND